jgi:hypothetical protein
MASEAKVLRCAIYTRKSTEHGLELEFNSLDAQRDACDAYILRRSAVSAPIGSPNPQRRDDGHATDRALQTCRSRG